MVSIINGEYKKFIYPAGEVHVVITAIEDSPVDLRMEFDGSEDIVILMLLVNAIKRNGFILGDLHMDYVPWGRQDRITQANEPLSIEAFADFINSFEFKNVYTIDAHSPVTIALIKNCEEAPQHRLYLKYFLDFTDHYLISPDGGALKKIRKCITDTTIDVVECSKSRDIRTGNITETKVYCDDFYGKPCIIVDDICDGGRTFIEIAKVLRKRNAGKIILYVTHGLFTKGLSVFDNLIDNIYTKEGRAK